MGRFRQLAVFDGDYATITVGLGPNDPLQSCVDQIPTNLIHDKWLCRTLPQRLRRAGFEIVRCDAHPYISEGEASYFLTLITRGADFLVKEGLISEQGAEALKFEARARIENDAFFGFISFNSVIARRPK